MKAAKIITMHQYSRPRRIALFFLFFLPLLSLALNALAWLKFGMDQPFFDDWRDYLYRRIGSFAPSDLFTPANGTMSPVGFALDAISLRFLGGNAIAYQLISMLAVLGGLLLLQWKLLLAALEDYWKAALCFVFTLFMLRPNSYWGSPNLAYHQALPLVFILWAIWLSVASTWRDAWRIPTIFFLGLLAGMSYISGSFGSLISGGILVALLFIFSSEMGADDVRKKRLLRAGIALACAGAITTAIQVRWAILGDKNTMSWQMGSPLHADFWWFGLGNVGQSLLLSAKTPALSMTLTLLICGVAFASVIWLIKRCFNPRLTEGQLRIAVIYLPLAGLLGIYMLQIMVARTHFRPPEVQTATDVFLFGYKRFHYFWATLLWPWLIAIGIVIWETYFPRAKHIPRLAPWIVGLLVVWTVDHGALRHQAFYRSIIQERKITAACMIQQLQRGEGITCPEFLALGMPDMTYAYLYARKMQASFVEHFPVLAIPLGADEPPPWFRWSRDKQQAFLHEAGTSTPLPGDSNKNAALKIDIDSKHPAQRCLMMDLRARIPGASPSSPQVIFMPLQAAAATMGPVSEERPPDAGGERFLHFRAESERGFSNTILFVPGIAAKELAQSEVEVRCRLTRPL